MIEYLLLDYQRPKEARNLLESIKSHSHFDYEVTYLSNGGNQDYVKSLKSEGLIDTLLLNPRNIGCGAATMQLFANCKSTYAFYIQVDHVLAGSITQDGINQFISLLKDQNVACPAGLPRPDGYSCVDLAGDQANPKGSYSERAQFINVEFYNSIPKSIGGPGPWNQIRWTEKCVQDYFIKNDLKIAHISPILFRDTGQWSVRSNPDGSQWRQRSDTKQLWMLKAPTQKYSWPLFTDEEWEAVLRTKEWKDGDIPSRLKGTPSSFTVPEKYWS
jgi:hypothetical protein